MPDLIQPCVLPKGHVGMPHPTWSNDVFSPRAMMACHARRNPTVGAAQGPCEHVAPDVVLSCVFSKGDDNMARLTSSDRACFSREMITYHTQHSLKVYAVKGQ